MLAPEPLPSIYSAVAVITPLLAMASNTSFILRFLDGEGSHLTHHREASRRRNQSTGAVLAALCWLWITYVHVIRVPFIGHMHALARSFVSGALFGLFVILVAWTGGASVPVAKGLSLSLIPAFGAAAAVLTFLRIGKARHVAARFSIIARGGPPGKKMHRFMDEESLEVIMRSAVPFSPSLEADPELVSGAATAVAHAQLHHFDGATTLINLSVAQAFLGASLVSARSTIARVRTAMHFPARRWASEPGSI